MSVSGSEPRIVGTGDFVYEATDHWHRLPQGVTMGEAVGVATDSQDRVYVFNRGPQPMMVFEPDGTFLRSWGTGRFVSPMGSGSVQMTACTWRMTRITRYRSTPPKVDCCRSWEPVGGQAIRVWRMRTTAPSNGAPLHSICRPTPLFRRVEKSTSAMATVTAACTSSRRRVNC